MNKLRWRRKRLILTLVELSNKIDNRLSPSMLHYIETGKRRITPRTAKLLASFYGITQQTLIKEQAECYQR